MEAFDVLVSLFRLSHGLFVGAPEANRAGRAGRAGAWDAETSNSCQGSPAQHARKGEAGHFMARQTCNGAHARSVIGRASMQWLQRR